jgi:hypothetical protein
MLGREQDILTARTEDQRQTALLSEVVLLDVMVLVSGLSLVGRRVVERDDRERRAATAEILRLRDLAEAAMNSPQYPAYSLGSPASRSRPSCAAAT